MDNSIAILVTGILAYGILANRLGFYWDEWPFLWFNHAFGREGVIKYFNTLRPFLGYSYATTIPILGTNPVAWQVFSIGCRCLSGISLWWALKQIWPKKSWTTSTIAVFFIIYPSFSQQSISVMWSHIFIILTCFFLSLGWMVRSVRQPENKWWMTILALVASGYHLFSIEYFFGLELLRPIILFFVLSETQPDLRRRIRQLFTQWLPYLVLSFCYLYWRIAIYQFPTYQPQFFEKLSTAPWQAIIGLAAKIAGDLKTVLVDAFVKLFQFPVLEVFGQRSTYLYWIIVLVGFIASAIYFHFYPGDIDKDEPFKTRQIPLLVLCGLALLLAGIPFIVTDLPVSLSFPKDRFTLPYILGASFLLVAIIQFIPQNKWLKATLIGIAIGLACGVQYQNADAYWQDWKAQRDFLWQLSWRAPAIKPGTLILMDELPASFESDNSITSPINWMYAPDYQQGDMPFLVAFITVRINTGVLTLKADSPVHQNYKVTDFYGSTSQAIVLNHQSPGCLRLLDPSTDSKLPFLSETITQALPLSRPDLVLSNPENVMSPMVFFGEEPAHGWCYYFEKADLARSEGDWELVTSLGDQAFSQGDYPNDPGERIVFIEGYAHMGDWEKARNQTRTAYKTNEYLSKSLCTAWQRIEQSTELDQPGLQVKNEMIDYLECNQ